MTDDIVLKTEGLTKRFGSFVAVENLNLEVRRRDIYGLLGLNGAGKTTTIRMIVRLIAPTEGKILAFGEDVRHNQLSVLNRIGAMVEIPQFYPYLSGRKNLDLLYGLSGGKESGRVEECLKLVGLAERGRDKVRAYSQGMRQRLGLAQAMLTRPELVILDEPTNGLDPQGILDIRRLIQQLNKDHGVTFLISSHLLHEIQLTCNRVAIVHKGKLRVQEEVATLLESTMSVSRVLAQPTDLVRAVLDARGLLYADEDDGAFRVKCGADVLPDIASDLHKAGCRLLELTPGRVSLEDYFMAETSREGTDAA